MLQPGDEIDIWVVERPLGQGGMGSVYRCHNRSAQRILAAIKTLDPSLNRVATAKARFVREAEILFALDHPNIVKVRNVRMDAEPPYIEMEFVEGESLESRIYRGPMPVPDALDLFRQAADALRYMHDAGVRHRDIKPSNMIIQKDGQLKLVDFGIATEQDGHTLTEAGQNFGSVSYAPPEWIEPADLDPVRWDLYSMGVVFYELLTGKLAFPIGGIGTSRQKALQVMISKQAHPPLDPGPTFPVDLRRVIRSMTLSKPDQRLGTAAQLVERLGAVDPDHIDAAATFDDYDPGPVSAPTWYPGMQDDSSGHTMVPDGGTMIPDAAPVVPDDRALERAANATPDPSPAPEPAPAPDPAPPTQEAQEPVAAPAPEPEPEPERSKAPVLIGVAVAAVALAGVGWWAWQQSQVEPPPLDPPPVTARAVDVVVTGVPADLPVAVELGGVAPESEGDALFHFAPLEPGPVTAVATLGLDCDTDQGLAAWCSRSEHALAVVAGDGTQTLTLALSPPPDRTVQLSAPRGTTLQWGDAPVELDRKGQGSLVLKPGNYDVIAEHGRCPDAARGCQSTDGQDCPKGCASWADKMVVPWDQGDLTLEIPLVVQGAAAPLLGNGPGPTETPAGAGSAAKAQVTNAQFATWLASHPDWLRDAAIAAGTADDTYLKGWDGASPPAGKGASPAVNVSWSAARAYCAGRGGLADVSAEPLSWPESGPYAWHEYRQADGSPAWLRADGMASTKVGRKDSRAFIGFRCAR